MKSKSLEKILKPCGVIFNEQNHTYTTPAGELYTGTTTVSEAWDKSFFLGPWYAKEMALALLSEHFEVITRDPKTFEHCVNEAKGAAKRKSELAKVNGTLVHDWIAAAIGSKIDDTVKRLPTPDSQDAVNAINAFAHWAKDKNIQWLASEEVVASHEHRVGGKLDAIAVIDGLTYLVDFKTSGQISPSYLLQCGGYDIQLREMGVQVMGYLILRIPKDGSDAESLTITNHDDMEFFRQTFLKQREAHKFYAYCESKLKGLNGKMKVDVKVEAPTQEKGQIQTKTKSKTNEQSHKTGNGQRTRKGSRARVV